MTNDASLRDGASPARRITRVVVVAVVSLLVVTMDVASGMRGAAQSNTRRVAGAAQFEAAALALQPTGGTILLRARL